MNAMNSPLGIFTTILTFIMFALSWLLAIHTINKSKGSGHKEFLSTIGYCCAGIAFFVLFIIEILF